VCCEQPGHEHNGYCERKSFYCFEVFEGLDLKNGEYARHAAMAHLDDPLRKCTDCYEVFTFRGSFTGWSISPRLRVRMVHPYQGYIFPSQVQKVASPSSTLKLSLPPSSVPFHPFSAITFNIHSTLSFGLMIPSTSQSKLTFDAISVLTSPGSTMIGTSALCISGLFQKQLQ
jgi:hypothetical protein